MWKNNQVRKLRGKYSYVSKGCCELNYVKAVMLARNLCDTTLEFARCVSTGCVYELGSVLISNACRC